MVLQRNSISHIITCLHLNQDVFLWVELWIICRNLWKLQNELLINEVSRRQRQLGRRNILKAGLGIEWVLP